MTNNSAELFVLTTASILIKGEGKTPKTRALWDGGGENFRKTTLKKAFIPPPQKKCSEGDDKYNFIQSYEFQVVIVLKSEISIHQIVLSLKEHSFSEALFP